MKKTLSIRDIRQALNRDNVEGWNDKRESFRRIKLRERLSDSEKEIVRKNIIKKFPKQKVLVTDILSTYFGWQKMVTTAIYMWER